MTATAPRYLRFDVPVPEDVERGDPQTVAAWIDTQVAARLPPRTELEDATIDTWCVTCTDRPFLRVSGWAVPASMPLVWEGDQA